MRLLGIVLCVVPASALAVELSPADRVESDPGLAPRVIAKKFEESRPALMRCIRATDQFRDAKGKWTVVVLTDAPDDDDRVRLTFRVSEAGAVDDVGAKGLFIDERCVEQMAESWTFPPTGMERSRQVKVALWFRFRTTLEERRAAFARDQAALFAFCKDFEAALKRAPADGEKVLDELVAKWWSRADLSTETRVWLQSITFVDGGAKAKMYEVGALEAALTNPACPALRAWGQKHGYDPAELDGP